MASRKVSKMFQELNFCWGSCSDVLRPNWCSWGRGIWIDTHQPIWGMSKFCPESFGKVMFWGWDDVPGVVSFHLTPINPYGGCLLCVDKILKVSWVMWQFQRIDCQLFEGYSAVGSWRRYLGPRVQLLHPWGVCGSHWYSQRWLIQGFTHVCITTSRGGQRLCGIIWYPGTVTLLKALEHWEVSRFSLWSCIDWIPIVHHRERALWGKLLFTERVTRYCQFLGYDILLHYDAR